MGFLLGRQFTFSWGDTRFLCKGLNPKWLLEGNFARRPRLSGGTYGNKEGRAPEPCPIPPVPAGWGCLLQMVALKLGEFFGVIAFVTVTVSGRA